MSINIVKLIIQFFNLTPNISGKDRVKKAL